MSSKSKRAPGTIVIKGIGGRTGKKMTDSDRKTLGIPKGKTKSVIKPGKKTHYL